MAADAGHGSRRVITCRVDDQHVHAVGAELFSDALRLDERFLAEERDVAPPIADQHHQWIHGRVTEALGAHDPQSRDEPVRQRCGSADRETLQALFRQVDGRRRLEHHACRATREDDQRHLIATQVGIAEQRQHRALGGLHALLGVHRGTGVDDEDDQRAGAAAAYLLTEILALEMERGPDPAGGLLGTAADLVRAPRRAWWRRRRCRSSSPSGSRARSDPACRCSATSFACPWSPGSGDLGAARSCAPGRSRPRRAARRCAGSPPGSPARSPGPGPRSRPPRRFRSRPEAAPRLLRSAPRRPRPPPPGRSPRNAPGRARPRLRPAGTPRPGGSAGGGRARARRRWWRRRWSRRGGPRLLRRSPAARARTSFSASSHARTVRAALLTTMSARCPSAPASMHTSAMNQLMAGVITTRGSRRLASWMTALR